MKGLAKLLLPIAALASSVVKPNTWVIWDTVTVAHLLGFTASEIHPRPALNATDLTFSCPPTKKTVRWITSIDGHAMWDDFMRRVDRADSERRAVQPPKN